MCIYIWIYCYIIISLSVSFSSFYLTLFLFCGAVGTVAILAFSSTKIRRHAAVWAGLAA